MTEASLIQIAWGFVAGAVLAAAYLWNLWSSVRGIGTARRPWMRLGGALALRLAVALGVFYALARLGGFAALLAAAGGFTVTRLIVVARLAPGHTERT